MADSISTMAAPTAAVGKMEKLTDTASARDPRAKVHTPAAGTMVSRSPVSTPGLGEIRSSLLSYEFSGMLSTPVFPRLFSTPCHRFNSPFSPRIPANFSSFRLRKGFLLLHGNEASGFVSPPLCFFAFYFRNTER